MGRERMLITGGSVLTMDPGLGDLERGDVLVEDGRVVAVAPHLEAGDAAVVDARARSCYRASLTPTDTSGRRRCAIWRRIGRLRTTSPGFTLA
jgi:hypothetical protein